MPSLERLLGHPKSEDRVRLTALRAGEADLIDNMAYTDAAEFPEEVCRAKFQTWDVPILGTSFITLNMDKGPFADKRLRQAAAHAIDRDAIKQAVFYGRGDIATSYYAPVSPWHAPGIRPYPEHDPEKARFLLRQAKAKGTQSRCSPCEASLHAADGRTLTGHVDRCRVQGPARTFTNCQCCDKSVVIGTLMPSPRRAAIALIRMAGSRVICCQQLRPRKEFSGFRSERADKLIVEARQTINKQKRLELCRN